jgi:hypothetical protein
MKTLKVNATKIKRGDRIGTLLNGIKFVSYIVHYPKSETVQIVYTDNKITWCTDWEEVEIQRPLKTKIYKVVRTEYHDYDKPVFIKSFPE